MTNSVLLLPIFLPLAAGLLVLLMPKNSRGAKEILSVLAAAANLLVAVFIFNKSINYVIPWAGFGIEFSLRLYNFSSFILGAAAVFSLLIALYSTAFMRDRAGSKQFYSYFLISLGFVNGAVLADNLVVLIFFWEGLLLTLFGMIASGGKDSFRTAIKMFIIVGITDLCMMVGAALVARLSGTLTISKICLDTTSGGGLAFALLMIGAISKGGSMPFHSWIPDAALDAPLPFMAFMPAALEKLLGIYFLTRISLDMFRLEAGSWLSLTMMVIGAATILLAVMMALIQKDYKKLLSFHAISQVGYMILGIGTALPVGIVGGLFHMLNNAMYKSCLFLTGGAVEKQTGTTDLEKLGGIGVKMPVTFICFLITAASISGVPPFNGFFSKELVYDAALERGTVFYLAALVGSFFTAASFLKLGHAAFLGKVNDENKRVKEVPFAMLIPMIIIAAGCVLFGVWRALAIEKLIQPVLGDKLGVHNFASLPLSTGLVIATLVVLAMALANHIIGSRLNGSGLKAVDHIHYAPVLSKLYERADEGSFDPYNIGLRIANRFSRFMWWCDRHIDSLYGNLAVKSACAASA
ncbi:MAG: proton-conducting transporter membrane subunit, partial [Candidatus Omnitrophica bacterium]|nr:proton-conducting transporter membrane subunit [Candidatus Omnitrophota bacterium]